MEDVHPKNEFVGLSADHWATVGSTTPLDQGRAITLPEGPQWVLDLDERAGQVARETNPPNDDRRLTKNPA